jgi:hypothetical protein
MVVTTVYLCGRFVNQRFRAHDQKLIEASVVGGPV